MQSEMDLGDSQSRLRVVRPARPAAGYIGGKKQLAERLSRLIDQTPHDLYAEPFVGMGGVFLRRVRAPDVEVINDRSQDVANFFRILQRHYEPFFDMLKWRLTSRAEFDRLLSQDPTTLTDLERAARFLYLQRLSFGGKVSGRTFGYSLTGPARFDTTKLGVLLEAIHDRLAGVTIECLDWRDFIARWDRPGALFFCDPPYFGTERYYGAGLFSQASHAEMAEALGGLKGNFILTINDLPQTREIYAAFRLESVDLTYQAGGADEAKAVKELIVSGP
ncbi:DNA adenine methylase [Rhodoblastus acidophilus]|uniref:DNA adenine methylase n=1 Tax=Rhodoblastus acidophilus TaxID=1074 RepID=UPI001FCEFE77|nr:DNA adenine methylase [Rhodoblastus acidophilus]